MTGLAKPVKKLATALRSLDKAGQEKVLLAHWYAQTYKFDQYVDLRDFCVQLQKQFPEPTAVGHGANGFLPPARQPCRR